MSIEIKKSHWLNLTEVFDVANKGTEVFFSSEEEKKLAASRHILEKFVDNRLPIYGVSTQFGDDANRVHVEGKYQEYLQSLVRRQNNVIRALNCGVGEEVNPEIIRATLLLRINAHIQGASGIRPEIVHAIVRLLNNNYLPIIRRYGSVGASGDLVPLSAIALTLMGEHIVRHKNNKKPAKQALKELGIKPFVLQMKEGLSIVNGTSFSTAIASMAIYRLCYLLPLSLATAAISTEAMLAMDSAYHPFVHKIKHHKGQIYVANFIQKCWKNSQLIRSLHTLRHEWRDKLMKHGEVAQEHVQDFYSLRCIAHGFGPFVENLEKAVKTLENEINSANDNPVIDSENEEIHHGANFMTDYIAVMCDHLRADVAKASTWLHALLGNLVHPRKNRNLPSNLILDPEEYTAFKTVLLMTASITHHNRSRTLPVAAVMLPTEGDNQDMVGLGPQSAFDLYEVTENYARIISSVLLAAIQAIELRGLQNASTIAKQLHSFVRKRSAFLEKDRPLSLDLENLYQDLRNGIDLIPPLFLKITDIKQQKMATSSL
jgi:histidine ammonia-lyase